MLSFQLCMIYYHCVHNHLTSVNWVVYSLVFRIGNNNIIDN